MELIFYDFEVFKHDWLVVFRSQERETIIVNRQDELEAFYQENKNNVFVGYNSRSYDQYIFKGILAGFNPKEINDFIIVQGKKGWEFSDIFNSIQLYNYDCMPSRYHSLKELEGFFGSDIKESDVDFNIDRKLTNEEITETIEYCRHDVEETIKVFKETINNFNSHCEIIKMFRLPVSSISKTQAQLSAAVLKCRRKQYEDEFDFELVNTLDIKKYSNVVEWFLNPDNRTYQSKLKTTVSGCPHIFGWGGLHGAIDRPVYRKGLIIHIDVQSFYPSIMITYDLLSRSATNKQMYRDIYNKRLALKKAGKKEEQAPYKIILNATYGICKDKYNAAYDPMNANAVCVNGQLLLLDLIEHLENYCELIQSNTDGLIIQIEDSDDAFEKIDDICDEWENRTEMRLSFDFISEIYQKDVNNYLWIDENGSVEVKNKYLTGGINMDNNLQIVREAMINYMVDKIPPEITINKCDDLIKFQRIVKISRKFLYASHGDAVLRGKTFRIFASARKEDPGIFKAKHWVNKDGDEKISNHKISETSEHVFIDNGNVVGKKVNNRLDKQYYIDLAYKRLRDFGIENV